MDCSECHEPVLGGKHCRLFLTNLEVVEEWEWAWEWKWEELEHFGGVDAQKVLPWLHAEATSGKRRARCIRQVTVWRKHCYKMKICRRILRST